MPRFDNGLEKHKTGHFGFSATKLDKLGATEYTLVTIIADKSGSTSAFTKEMESALKEVIRACQHSPRADNLMIRFVTFENDYKEVHGFKLLEQCNLDDYNDSLCAGGQTALYDATLNGVEALNNYGKQLLDQDFAVNGILFVLTDGMDNHSKFGTNQVKQALQKAVAGENLESLVSILIAVNIVDSQASVELDKFNKEVGFTQFIELKDASKSTLAKLAKFVSKSISSQSQALNSGAPSPSVTF
jgi:uncharacterized protein YegL